MKQVTINQYDFCEKTSFSKGSISQHEKKCFYNPTTQSCTTCFWFSRVHGLGDDIACYVGKLKEANESEKQKLKTMCKSWTSADVVEEIDLFQNRNGNLDRLMADDRKYFKTLAS
jgi:hypothetical protein